jgi:hypothetical protein
MPSPMLADLGQRVRAAFAPLAGPLTYRTSVTFSARAAVAAPVGATTLSLNGLPSGLAGVQAGDRINAGPIVVSAPVSAAGGSIANIPLSAPLPAPIAAGALVTLQRDSDTPCQGWPEDATTAIAVGVSVVTGNRVFNVLADSLPAAPAVNACIVEDGKAWQIKAATTDPTGAVWRLTTV